jgi:hypothetical protein
VRPGYTGAKYPQTALLRRAVIADAVQPVCGFLARGTHRIFATV